MRELLIVFVKNDRSQDQLPRAAATVDGAMKHLIAMAVNDNADADAFIESFDRTVTPVAVQSIVRKHLGFHWGVQYLPPISIIELRLTGEGA